MSQTIVEFASVWFLAAAFPGPNAVNCISMAGICGLRGATAVIGGILSVACFYVAVVWLVAELFFLPTYTLVISFVASFWLIFLGLMKLTSKSSITQQDFSVSLNTEGHCSFSTIFTASAGLSFANPTVIGFYFSILSPFFSDPLAEPVLIVVTLLLVTATVYLFYALLGLFIHVKAYGLVEVSQKYRLSGMAYVLIGCFFVYKALSF